MKTNETTELEGELTKYFQNNFPKDLNITVDLISETNEMRISFFGIN